jgi:hypothetical protein
VWGLVVSLCDAVEGFAERLLAGGTVGGGGGDGGGGRAFATLGEWKAATFLDKSASYILQYVVLPGLCEIPEPTGTPLLLCLDSLDEALLVTGGAEKSIAALVFSTDIFDWEFSSLRKTPHYSPPVVINPSGKDGAWRCAVGTHCRHK